MNTNKLLLLIASTWLGLGILAPNLFARTWTDVSGKFSIEADFVEETDKVVKLRKTSGEVIEIRLDQLSLPDRRLVIALKSRTSPQEVFTVFANAWKRGDWEVVNECLTDTGVASVLARQTVNANGGVPPQKSAVMFILGKAEGVEIPEGSAERRAALVEVCTKIKKNRGLELFTFGRAGLENVVTAEGAATAELDSPSPIVHIVFADEGQEPENCQLAFKQVGDIWLIDRLDVAK